MNRFHCCTEINRSQAYKYEKAKAVPQHVMEALGGEET
jgi:hypothetical protein